MTRHGIRLMPCNNEAADVDAAMEIMFRLLDEQYAIKNLKYKCNLSLFSLSLYELRHVLIF